MYANCTAFCTLLYNFLVPCLSRGYVDTFSKFVKDRNLRRTDRYPVVFIELLPLLKIFIFYLKTSTSLWYRGERNCWLLTSRLRTKKRRSSLSIAASAWKRKCLTNKSVQ